MEKSLMEEPSTSMKLAHRNLAVHAAVLAEVEALAAARVVVVTLAVAEREAGSL
jgi:hypothetical protein